MSELSRATLRRKLKGAGLPMARNHTYADGLSIVEFVDYWGLQPSAPGYGATPGLIKQALKHLGLVWRMGNMILVYKDQPDSETQPTDDLPRPIQGTLL